ncbi:MAG: type II secretion system protein GspL [Rhodoferax sp.]|nr:type II secretion system protein GspL [Rhodoferax sp.]
MPTLILQLPWPITPGTAAVPSYDYVLTADGQQPNTEGQAPLNMLPSKEARNLDVVAVIPAQALSWHRLALPERVLRSILSGRMESARMRSVLAGALEERLLDDAAQLHFAVFAATPVDAEDRANAWVASCDRSWLQTHTEGLEAAAYPLTRIVAQCLPQAEAGARVLLSGDAEQAQMLLCTQQGVALLPLQAASVELARQHSPLLVLAEPSAMGLAEQHFGTGVIAQTRTQQYLEAAQSPWNLAQLELSASPGGRFFKRLQNAWQQLSRGPQWRPVRWGLLALALVQVLALNALAWQKSSQLAARREALAALLQQTFPDVKLVVDAPLQMQRAVDDLARSRGLGNQADAGRMLSALAAVAPKELNLSAIELSGQQLRLRGKGVDAALAQTLQSALDTQGLRLRFQDGQLLLEAGEKR